jgi:hypothetical protein
LLKGVCATGSAYDQGIKELQTGPGVDESAAVAVDPD